MDEPNGTAADEKPQSPSRPWGICSDITTCKSDMWNCLECKAFVADTEQTEYYREQIALWREKQVRFSAFPIICENAKRNAGLFESILKSIETDV